MDNDIRVVTDREAYLLAAPVISKSETEIVFRNWLRTEGLSAESVAHDVSIIGIDDIHLPMAVTSVESRGRWSLVQGAFQTREYDRDQRQYERDYLAYQAEEKRQKAVRETGGQATLPPLPRAPDREDYYDYMPDQGEYNVAFKGIFRAFGEAELGGARHLLNDAASALDQLLRRGFPAAEAVAAAPAPINRGALNTLLEHTVSDKGIGWLKEHAQKYEKVKKLAISDVSYGRECNIVFVPVRMITYAFAGGRHIVLSDPIRNEYILGTPPAIAPVALPPVAAPARMNMKLVGSAAAGVLALLVLGGILLKGSGRHEPAGSAPATTPASPAVSATAPQASTGAAAPAGSPPPSVSLSLAAPDHAAPASEPAPLASLAASAPALSAPPAAAPPAASTPVSAPPAAVAPVVAISPPPPPQPAAVPQPAKVVREVAAVAPAPRPVSRPAPVFIAPPAPAQVASVAPAAAIPAASPARPAIAAPDSGIDSNFSSGTLRLASQSSSVGYNEKLSKTLNAQASAQDWSGVAKTVISERLGNDLGYYYLGEAAQKKGMLAAARTYYMLSITNSERSNSATQCTPGYDRDYSAKLCHGITLPYNAERALDSLAAPPAAVPTRQVAEKKPKPKK